MSTKEYKRRNIASAVMKEAWSIKRRTILYVYSIGTALRLAWSIIRGQVRKHCTKVAGVSFETRQKFLERLLRYPSSQVVIELMRQPGNLYDEFATLVIAKVKGKGKACIGYLSSRLAATIAPLMDSGHQIVVTTFDITGGGSKLYGCNLSYFLA